MNQERKTVRVFISSTFRDMHAERDHLVTVVFRELRERVEQLGLEFFDVDLPFDSAQGGRFRLRQGIEARIHVDRGPSIQYRNGQTGS